MRQYVGSKGMSNANNGAGHIGAEDVDHMQQIAGVVVPARIIAHGVLIQNTAVALVCDVGDPYATDPKPVRFGRLIQLRPEGLVQLFGKAIGMGAYDSDIARLRIRVILGDVLLDGQIEDIVLRVDGSPRVFSDVL